MFANGGLLRAGGGAGRPAPAVAAAGDLRRHWHPRRRPARRRRRGRRGALHRQDCRRPGASAPAAGDLLLPRPPAPGSYQARRLLAELLGFSLCRVFVGGFFVDCGSVLFGLQVCGLQAMACLPPYAYATGPPPPPPPCPWPLVYCPLQWQVSEQTKPVNFFCLIWMISASIFDADRSLICSRSVHACRCRSCPPCSWATRGTITRPRRWAAPASAPACSCRAPVRATSTCSTRRRRRHLRLRQQVTYEESLQLFGLLHERIAHEQISPLLQSA